MSNIMNLVRADLRDFAGYRSARSEKLHGDAWLNANEAAIANTADADGQCRRYPEPQPAQLLEKLAALYDCRPTQLIAGRGSDEAIDLLVRAFCTPGAGAIVTTPPTFGMYAVCARLHGARVVEVPLLDRGDTFACDFDAIADRAVANDARLVFLCSPGNPTGTSLPAADVAALARRLDGSAIVVVDEAYQEFASAPSAIALLEAHPNVVVLRTLSKAHALAGLRLGVAVGDDTLIATLRRCQAPYPLPAPCTEVALRALCAAPLRATHFAVSASVAERSRLAAALGEIACVRAVYRSEANFVLVRFVDADSAFAALLTAGVVVRDVRAQPGLGDALRITVGTKLQNDRVVAALGGPR